MKETNATQQLKSMLNLNEDSTGFSTTLSTSVSSVDIDENVVESKPAKVPFYSENLYVDHSRRRNRKRQPQNYNISSVDTRQLLASDGTIGYGGSEYIQQVFNYTQAPQEKKYKWDILWNDFPSAVKEQVTCDSVSLFSVTDFPSAEMMSACLLSLEGISEQSFITDATSCIGGNSFSFIRHFKQVFAVELDQERCDILRKNLALVSSSSFCSMNNKFEVICGDCLDVIPSLEANQDIIFFDPPWGGETYKSRGEIQLFLSNLSIGQVCKKVADFTKYIAIKLPAKNIDEDRIVEESGCDLIKTEQIGSKMRMMILEKKKKRLTQREMNFLKTIGLGQMGLT